jgi:hypothetical protein
MVRLLGAKTSINGLAAACAVGFAVSPEIAETELKLAAYLRT